MSTFTHSENQWRHEEMKTDRDDMFRAEDSEFLKAVAEDLPITCTIAESRKSLQAAAAGLCCKP